MSSITTEPLNLRACLVTIVQPLNTHTGIVLWDPGTVRDDHQTIETSRTIHIGYRPDDLPVWARKLLNEEQADALNAGAIEAAGSLWKIKYRTIEALSVNHQPGSYVDYFSRTRCGKEVAEVLDPGTNTFRKRGDRVRPSQYMPGLVHLATTIERASHGYSMSGHAQTYRYHPRGTTPLQRLSNAQVALETIARDRAETHPDLHPGLDEAEAYVRGQLAGILDALT